MIELQSLTKRYGNFTAVDSISLEAARGEVFGFLGPNGAGKTTTIRILAGLSLPTAGVALVGGIDVVSEPEKAKAITGFVPDRPFLYEKLTGWELLRFVADLYSAEWNAAQARASRLLDYLDLTEWAPARIENYSHGMKQKLVLTAALVHDPSVVIIDEPMVGLDTFAQNQVKKLLRTLASEGRTIFLTTHTLSVAEAVCDRLAIIHRGRIVATGSPGELKTKAGRPGSPLEDVFLQITYPEETAS
ncbi:MAG: ABC transporter ATP-binding protein [Thermoanaerobaculia bacterium]